MRLKVYTIGAERPFLATLAHGVLGMAAGDPLRLPRTTVLLPTRRAVGSLREAFLRIASEQSEAGRALLLPRMRPVGDLDSDELSLADGTADDGHLGVPPAIPELRRRLLLTRLVLSWGERRGADPLLPGQAAALAASLARLLDTAATEGATFANLAELVPEDLAEHWRIVHRFLEILPHYWPQIIAEEGALDPTERRNRLLARQATIWRASPPRDPVVAAGLMGGIPAVTELLSVVAALDQGAVILPGLDRDCDEAQWQAIEQDESHPQYLMAGLLRDLEFNRADVRDWPPDKSGAALVRGLDAVADLPLFAHASRGAGTRARRIRLVGEALRPASTTDAWRRLAPQPLDALEGLSRYDCASPQQEAVTIALLLRRKLETPGATAALVTPDRELARRVAVELRRWGVEIDNSAGMPLSRSPPGVFLRLVLELVESQLAPVPMLAALKHPLASGGLAPVAFRDLSRELEKAIRGPRPAPGFAGLKAALAADYALQRFVERLEACLGSLPELLDADTVPLARLAASHIEAAERLAATASETGSERLWREAAGEVAARFCHELIEAARDFPPLPGRCYPALFEALAAGAVVRPAYGRHPRLAIWGPLEARLQHPDLLVLGGLNEGTWPGSAGDDPWMSRQMRREFGIAPPERAIGLAAHDFAQAIGAPEVALTRAARSEGVPAVPSRWLLRLDTVLRAIGLDAALRADVNVRQAAEQIDHADMYRPLAPPSPRPPLASRPRTLSVTQIETWLRDPYAIYAGHILKLKALDELDADPGRAELGTIIHRTLEEIVRCFPRGLPSDAEGELLRIGREQFGATLSRPGAWAFWWPRFERIVRWLVKEDAARQSDVRESFGECEGRWTFTAHGGPFTITAKADRIDRLADGGVVLVDYKTGTLPLPKVVQAGFAPQLPLEAAILENGGFKNITGTAKALEYWRLTGGEPAGERCPIDAGDPGGLIERVFKRVRGPHRTI